MTQAEPIAMQRLRMWPYALILGGVWSVVVLGTLGWNLYEEKLGALETARIQARAALEPDPLYRQWRAGHGPDYAGWTGPSTDGGPATRPFPQAGVWPYGLRGHVTSLKPMCPTNEPDVWEEAALRACAHGETEFSSVELVGGEWQLRLMHPMLTEERCLRCHGAQGFKVGELRGGITVDVPMAALWEVARGRCAILAVVHGTLWLLGLTGIGFGCGHVRRRIRERDRAHAAQQQQMQELFAIFNSMEGAVYVADARTHELLAVNRYVIEHLGRGHAPTKCCDVFSDADARPCARCAAEVLAGPDGKFGLPVTWDYDQPETGRSYHCIDQALHWTDGRLARMVIAIDITDRKQAERDRAKLAEQLREVQKLESIGVLAGGVAHDFNNLLTSILGNANLVLDKLPLGSPLAGHVERIERGAHRAADLTRQMLAYAGKGPLELGCVDLSAVAADVATLLPPSVGDHVVLSNALSASLPTIHGDATQIRQVLLNLLTNATESLADAAGAITIRSGSMGVRRDYLDTTVLGDGLPEGQYVFLEVADTGCGMDPETVPKIFDPFFSTKFTGRGLGLAAVLGIVRRHGGTIHVESRVGQGTRIRVLFPAARVPADKGDILVFQAK